MKQLIEDDKLIFNDYDIIAELTTFIQKGQDGKQRGCSDDLSMCGDLLMVSNRLLQRAA